MATKKIIRYQISPNISPGLNHLHPLLARIYMARNVHSVEEIDYGLTKLLPFHDLQGIDAAVACLYDALSRQQRVLIIGDYDVDGATSTALAILALKSFGFQNVAYLVPNRFKYGYGLTQEIVEFAAREHKPELIITVDNGISSIDGVAYANKLDIRVLITDHHLPAETLPEAVAIVDPNRCDDQFGSKNLAGVGVIFYVMMALRNYLRGKEYFTVDKPEPNLGQFLDLVALGTVADVVPLDRNNRILVHNGLMRIRAGKCRMGIKALLAAASRDYTRAQVGDLAYVVAPRLNAAGRLEDMSLGIECLMSEAFLDVRKMANELNTLNTERREIEKDMHKEALNAIANLKIEKKNRDINTSASVDQQKDLPSGICLFEDSWHQGVVGIIASRIKDKYNRPTIAFAFADTGDGKEKELKGSARSVEGVHVRDLLSNIAARHPDLILKFGGHARAAGLSLKHANYIAFSKIFAAEVAKYLDDNILHMQIYSDGELPQEHFTIEIAELLNHSGPWGHGFVMPQFDAVFELIQQRLVGQRHLKMTLRVPNTDFDIDAICFNVDTDKWPNHRCNKVHVVYRLDINEYNGRRSVQLLVEYLKEL